jgi:hypothetical protein
VSIQSEQLEKDESSNLIYATDSLSVSYSFHGNGIPVRVKIMNNQGKPLFVDWNNSVLIMNGQRVKLRNIDSRISMSGTTFNADNVHSYTNMNGVIRNTASVSIIPNDAFESVNLLNIHKHISLSDHVAHSTKIAATKGKKGAHIEHFEPDNSLNKFRVFLAMSYDPTFQELFYVDNSFYVSEIVYTDVMPEHMVEQPNNRGYVIRSGSSNNASSEGGTGFAVFAALIIIPLLFLISR